MNKELPGFEKSAPGNRSGGRGQGPVSAWDIDLSPFHRLLEQQTANNQQLTDIFCRKMEEFVGILREQQRQLEKKGQTFQDKLIENYKGQSQSNAVLSDGIGEILEHIGKFHQLFKETSEKFFHLFERMQDNAYSLSRSRPQECSSSHILQPLEKLVILEEDTLQHMESILSLSRSWQNFRELLQHQQELFITKLGDLEKRLENIEDLLISLGLALQKQLPDQEFSGNKTARNADEDNILLQQIAKSCQEMTQTLEKIYQTNCNISQKQREVMEKDTKARRMDNFIFLLVILIALVLFACLFLSN